MILAIDPGPEKSQFVIWNGSKSELVSHGHLDNQDMLNRFPEFHGVYSTSIVIEGIASYGMAVGKETFDTCIWIGRFQQDWLRWSEILPDILYRKDVKMHLCHTMKAKDANIRQALIDRYGHPGTKKAKGRLYGVSKHAWAALALAVTYAETKNLTDCK
jgi:hypothetical protein